MNIEQKRLAEGHPNNWYQWGPYLSERQWGTVREDYSPQGNAWDYLPHEQSRRRAYRWGEDGLAGLSDETQMLCLSLALWNQKDPILKERLFGLTNSEGNHGEDVKEQYYYVDATPTHSYLKMLYKYPHQSFPYADLVAVNGARSREEPEYELIDTGIFNQQRYFDVVVEYAKAGPKDILMRITAFNRSQEEEATLDILPQLWFRNTWSWKQKASLPQISLEEGQSVAWHDQLGKYHFAVKGASYWLFTDNNTNPLVFGNSELGYYKDAFHRHVIEADPTALNPELKGTKVAAHLRFTIPPGGSQTVCARLSLDRHAEPFGDFDQIIQERLNEANAFYADLQTGMEGDDAKLVHRQALAGMIWSKQYFYYDVEEWIEGDPNQPKPAQERKHGRNSEWRHLNNADIISMPDKWEYPWYAAWDLAFHTVALALVDPFFAKQQLVLITREWYMHPNGQLPAYEWAFGDVNPPVHAWATWRVFLMDRDQMRKSDPEFAGDLAFLERVFHKLMLNFTWWVNRKDTEGRNVFQGGFLGLDNIGVFDRSAPLPSGSFINQADGTSWMAMYALNLMRIALELAQHNHVYEDIATKFFEHFLHIAEAMNNMGDTGIGLWNEEDQFFYDVLQKSDGEKIPLKVRSLVGLIPLCAVEILDQKLLDKVPEFTARLKWFLNYRPNLAKLVSRWEVAGVGETHLLSLLRGHRMKALLGRMLDQTEFLSDYGIRAVSKHHQQFPYVFRCGEEELTVGYHPGESNSGLFGGNSNWRGPIWMPINFLLLESLKQFHHYYGDEFKVECPTGSGNFLTIAQIVQEIGRRLSSIFLKDQNNQRPVFLNSHSLPHDPHFDDLILYFEYFHGDSGSGLGASHQTGWTGLVSLLLQKQI